jgi:imidazolonepropionase-like amidohydrolase
MSGTLAVGRPRGGRGAGREGLGVGHRVPALLAEPAGEPGRLWLVNAQIWDGTDGAGGTGSGAAVLIEDGIIADGADLSPPPSARVIDLGGRFLMPGLTDVHTHASGEVPQPAHGAEPILSGTAAHFLQAELRAYLTAGVTTIRVTGSQGLAPQEARQAMRYGAFRGPRLLTCGRIISPTAPGGRFYGDMYREADGPDDIRRAVREQIRAGADFVKLMTTGARSNELEDPDPLQLTEQELAAVVDEAHRLGYRVCAHAEGLDGCEAAIRHGVDTVEHGMYLHRRPGLLDQMAANGQVLVPTLSGYYWMAGFGDVIDPADAVPAPDMPPLLSELAVRNLNEGAETMRAARDAGVPVALGSDVYQGTALDYQRMIFHGLTPDQALTAATATAARALGLDHHIGTVEPGKRADLLVLDGDPREDPRILEHPHLVLQGGTTA